MLFSNFSYYNIVRQKWPGLCPDKHTGILIKPDIMKAM